jgi:hypothetical protein
MATTNVYTLYAVKFGSMIGQINSWGMDTGTQELVLGSDGAADPTYAAVMGQRPTLTFTTTDIYAALSSFGIDGTAISSGKVALQKLAEGGVRSSSADHILLTIANGIVVPTTLNATQGAQATLSYTAHITSSDGTTAPITMTVNNLWSAITSAIGTSSGVANAFTLGPVSINGTTLDGVQNVSVDFGINVFVADSDGQPYPTFASIMTRQPVITFSTYDLELFNIWNDAIGVEAQSATDSTIEFAKLTEGGVRAATGSARLTFDEGIVSMRTIPANQGNAIIGQCQYTPTHDGTNAIIVVDATT